MDNKFQDKDLFESDFDTFEIDDGFLLQINADLKKNSHSKKEFGNLRKANPKEVEKSGCKANENNYSVDKNVNYNNLPLFIEDLSESDFFDVSKTKIHCSKKKVGSDHKDDKRKELSTKSTLINHLSPILGSKVFHKNNISSSTPLKPNNGSDASEKLKTNQKDLSNCHKNSQFDYLGADLFDDWDVDESNKYDTQKDTVTFSQALKLIEEAESAKQLTLTKAANESIDMLTGEIVTAATENLFEQSLDVLQSVRRHNDKVEFSENSIIITDDVNVKSKPPAAQKLNFDSKSTNCFNLDNGKQKEIDFGNICFSSDDDFDFFTQDLLGKLKKNSKFGKPTQGVPNLINKSSDSVIAQKNFDLNDSNAAEINIKRRKRVNIIESDTTEDSPSPKFRRQRKPKINMRSFQDDSVRGFIDLEAETTGEIEVSSDEIEEEDEYERSFLDEESYHTQNYSADMTAKYLQSVKDFSRTGTFKIPTRKPYNPEEVFSQAPEENIDYQIDSFCVNDVEEEAKTDLSDLEIAEKILEMGEKKRKKRLQKSKKIK